MFGGSRFWALLLVPLAAAVVGFAEPGRMAGGDSGSAGRAFTQYTMTAFTNSSESKMFVYDSTDGANFRPVGGGHAYSPPAGLVRDPSMMRHLDGWYYLVYTTGWDGNTIGFARSRDRVHWDFLRNFTMPIRGAAHTWAPVWFLDDGRVSFIVSVSTGGPFLPYLFTATDPALTNWTAPTQLLGIGPNYIDTIVIRTGAIYHAFTKNETTKFVEHAVGPTAVGPFLFVGLGNWAGWGAPREGQSIIHLDNGGWRIFLDGYTIGKYFYSDSHDGFLTWSPPRELPGLSGHVRHFTVLKELARR